MFPHICKNRKRRKKSCGIKIIRKQKRKKEMKEKKTSNFPIKDSRDF